MTIFWILAAGLACLAVLFAIAPLLSPDTAANDVDQDELNLALFKQQLAELDADLGAGKLDQSQYESARRDLEREVLHDVSNGSSAQAASVTAMLPGPRVTMLALALAVPASALVLYLAIGEQHIIPRLASGAGAVSAPGHTGGADLPPLEELVTRLEQRMQQTPEDAEGWMMLGRTYFATGNTQKAETALARAYELTPDDAQVVLAYAETIAANNDNNLEGRPAELISEALKAAPNSATARWLSGMVAYQRGQFTAAAVAWKQTLSQLDPSGEDAAELRQLIDEAEQRAGVPPEARQLAQADSIPPIDAGEDSGAASETPTEGPASAPAPEASDTAVADTNSGITVEVALAPELAERAAPDATVFVYAKAAAGPPMPLAVQRVTVADLPLTLTLDDSMAMMPAMRLSGFPEVVVGARVSASGQATPQSGDIEGETGPIASSTAAPVRVQIDSIRP
jgi:cytochrome c-type biogenesis protein CcmH